MLRSLVRPLVAAPFVIDSLDALRRPREHSRKIERYAPALRRLGLGALADAPTVTTRAMAVATLGAATMLATGRAPRTSAAVLTVLSLPIAAAQTAAAPTLSDKLGTAVHRGALTGAVILAALDREGSPSLAWRAQTALAQMRDSASRKAELVANQASDTLRSAGETLTDPLR